MINEHPGPRGIGRRQEAVPPAWPSCRNPFGGAALAAKVREVLDA